MLYEVITSIETYETLTGKMELYSLLSEGLKSAEEGKGRPAKEVFSDLKRKINK